MRPRPFFGWGGWGWRRRQPTVVYGGSGSGCGCTSMLLVAAVILMIGILLMVSSQSMGSTAVTSSTIEREALPRGSVVETGYYTDELGWIGNPTTLTAGMKNFYQQTGVQPYLYITDTIGGSHTPSDADAEAFAYAKYNELFSDEAHLLLIFFEYDPNNYHTWYLCGIQAKSVMDSEAMDILLDYIDRYYYQDLSDEEFFSKAFNDAGKRIMEVTTSPWIPVLMVAGVIIVVIVLFTWWGKAKAQKNAEDERTKEILNTPLEAFGDSEIDDLAKKYD